MCSVLLPCRQHTSRSFPPNQAPDTLTVSFLANKAADPPAHSAATDNTLCRDEPHTDLLPGKTSHSGGPGSFSGQFVWDFWRTKGHWNSFFFLQYFGFPLSVSFNHRSILIMCHLPYIILVTDGVVKQTQFLRTTQTYVLRISGPSRAVPMEAKTTA